MFIYVAFVEKRSHVQMLGNGISVKSMHVLTMVGSDSLKVVWLPTVFFK